MQAVQTICLQFQLRWTAILKKQTYPTIGLQRQTKKQSKALRLSLKTMIIFTAVQSFFKLILSMLISAGISLNTETACAYRP